MVRRTLPFFALLAPLLAEAAAPPLIPITGYLTDTTGAPIDGSQTLHLKLYDGSGTLLWSENQSVDVDNGQFTAYLGDVTTVDLSTFRDNGSLMLGVAVGTGSEMTPRFELATAPFAGYAQYCDDADTVGGIDPADLLQVGDPVDWSVIANRPTGLDDGDQGATYTNGAGLNLSTNQFSVDQPTIDAWAKAAAFDTIGELTTLLDSVYMSRVSCTNNQLLVANSSGTFVCTDASTFGTNEATVDGYVANNGYVAASALGTAAYTASSAYATAAQGATADGALQRSGGTMTGAVVFPGGPGGWAANGTVGVGTAPSSAMVDIQGRRTVALTGTLGVLAGSAAVVGVGTQFLTQVNVNDTLLIGSQPMTVASIASNTALTLTAPHTAGAASITAYVDGDLLKVRNGAGALVLSVDKSGAIHEPKRPWFLATDSNGWQSAPSLWSTVTYNTVIGGNSGGWYNPSSGVFTVPVTGLYECNSHHYLDSTGTMPNYIHHNISCNGDHHCSGKGAHASGGDYSLQRSPNGSSTCTRFLSLVKGDLVSVDIYLNGGGTYRYGQHSQFGCVLLAGD